MLQNSHPLKITFTFASPVVMDSEYPIHLDALLAYAMVESACENRVADAWLEGTNLPLERAGEGDSWVFKASRLIFMPAAPREMLNMQRKSDPTIFYDEFDKGLWGFPLSKNGAPSTKTPPTINTKSGQFRAYQFYVAVQWMEKAEAWCVGDRGAIEQLLGRLAYVGKMGRNGWGAISDIRVEVDPEANEKWAIRVLPEDVPGTPGIEYTSVMSPPRAPYWNKCARIPMREPVVI